MTSVMKQITSIRGTALRFLLIGICLSSLLGLTTSAQAATYYVDGGCAKDGDGSQMTCASILGGRGAFSSIHSAIGALSDCTTATCPVVEVRGAHAHPGEHDDFDGLYPVTEPLVVDKGGFCDSQCQAAGWSPQNSGQLTIRGYNGEIVYIGGIQDVTWTQDPITKLWIYQGDPATYASECNHYENKDNTVFVRPAAGSYSDYKPLMPEAGRCSHGSAIRCWGDNDCGSGNTCHAMEVCGTNKQGDGTHCMDPNTFLVYLNPPGDENPNTGANRYGTFTSHCGLRVSSSYVSLKDVWVLGGRSTGASFRPDSGQAAGLYLSNFSVVGEVVWAVYIFGYGDALWDGGECVYGGRGVSRLGNRRGCCFACLRSMNRSPRWTFRNVKFHHLGQGWDHLEPPWNTVSPSSNGGPSALITTTPYVSDITLENVVFEDSLGGWRLTSVNGMEVKDSKFVRTMAFNFEPEYDTRGHEVSIHDNVFDDTIFAIRGLNHCADAGFNLPRCYDDRDCSAGGTCSISGSLCGESKGCPQGEQCEFVTSCTSDADCASQIGSRYTSCVEGYCRERCFSWVDDDGEFGVRIYNNTFSNAGEKWYFDERGVIELDYPRVEVYNNTFEGSSFLGGRATKVSIHHSVSDVSVKNNIFANLKGGYGIRVSGSCYGRGGTVCATDEDCPQYKCAGGQCERYPGMSCATDADCPRRTCSNPLAQSNNLSIDNNLYWNLETPIKWGNSIISGPQELCAIASQECNGHVGDPQLIDAQSTPPDLHIGAQSAAIDAVNSSSIPAFFTTDFEGDTRPQGSAWDIGADEYVPSAGCFPGDVNCDGTAGDSSDIQLVVNVRLGLVTDPAIIQRADLNSDTKVDAADIQAIVNLRLRG